ncbi:MAG TPA: ATP-grasp domain-containing protein [Vicinamibacterales bacterium]
MKVLVTDGSARPALAITRSLGRRGHSVLVAEKYSPCLAQTSRYCSARLVHPDPGRDEVAVVDVLAEEARARAVDVIVPVTDIMVGLVTRHRDRFEPACRVPFADAALIARANDKVELLRIAGAIGVPMPRSVVLEQRESPVPPDLPFPVVVKPHRSRVRTAEGWLSCGVGHAHDRAALDADLARRHPSEFPLIIQERITGHGLGIFTCYHDGAPLAWFSHRRVREKPPWGGVSVLCESVPVPPRARDYAERLLGHLGWTGIAMVEFKHDPRDDEPKLMEINPRFWGSLQLAIDAGVDFPALLVEGAAGGRRAGVGHYRTGIRNRWFWGDLDSLLLRLSADGSAPVPLDGLTRTGAVVDFLKLWRRHTYYDNPKLDDVRPWLFESVDWFRRLR